jgi:hypothetical protein
MVCFQRRWRTFNLLSHVALLSNSSAEKAYHTARVRREAIARRDAGEGADGHCAHLRREPHHDRPADRGTLALGLSGRHMINDLVGS